MNQKDKHQSEILEQNKVYPIHYHGHIAYYDPNEKELTKTDTELMKHYDTHHDILGIG